VLSGLQTVVQLRAPQLYRGRVLSFFLVALGVAYPVGSLVQGPVIDRIGIGWTTAAAALLLSLIMLAVAWRRPGVIRAITSEAPAGPAGPVIPGPAPPAG
jgi:predicted MFS family arabinose efflux permease